jgi:3,4-dihydroxy 2-butanone 4-phosphate synthase/GTP cyclohydrolase II
MAQSGGVLMRAGHTEAGCDLAKLADLTPAAVICEILKDDGSMARLPDLLEFAQRHDLKIGTIADLIHFRSATESLTRRVMERDIETPHGRFHIIVYLEKHSGALHLALVRGEISAGVETLVRVHEPLSILDLLDSGSTSHSWGVHQTLAYLAENGGGVLVLLNCEQGAVDVIERLSTPAERRRVPQKMDLLTYGIGAQILRDLGVRKMRLLARPRKMPSMAGWELEVAGFVAPSTEASQ